MRLDEAFSRWRAASNCPDLPWDRVIDFTQDATFYDLLAFVALDQSVTSELGPRAFHQLNDAMLQDVLELQSDLPDGCNRTNLRYLQFEMTLSPMRLAVNCGEFGSAHDWLANSLAEDVGIAVQRELHVARLEEFMASTAPWIVANRGSTIVDWSFAFYYYCRRRAAFLEVAVLILPSVLDAIYEFSPTEDRSIDALCMIVNWAVAYNHPAAEVLVLGPRTLFDDPVISPQSRVRIAVLFSTAAGFRTDRSPRAWAAWALVHGGRFLSGHEPLQLLWTLVDTVEDWDRLRPDILAATESYSATLRPLRSPVAIAQAVDLRSDLLNPAFFSLHRFERADDFCSVLQRWYDVPLMRRIPGNVLFVSHNHMDGTAFLGARTQLIPRAEVGALDELVRVTNRALGLNITLQGERDAPILADRPAQPNYDEGEWFEVLLRRTYRFERMDAATLEGARALALFQGYPHPIQALMAATRGDTLPITSSLQEPEQDRPVRRVLLWDTQGDYYSTFEIDAVEQLFLERGIDCVRAYGANCTVEEFLAGYSDPSFDIIWVAGHAELDHWRDGSPRLLIGNDLAVGIEQLVVSTPEPAGRRLVVLNVCDGGMAAVNGGIHRIGLAPMTANCGQATISHHWPVSPLVAGAFGAVLASGLARGLGFFGAFRAALDQIRRPVAEIAATIRDLVPDQRLVQRLENADIPTENIFHWGSPCFFQ